MSATLHSKSCSRSNKKISLALVSVGVRRLVNLQIFAYQQGRLLGAEVQNIVFKIKLKKRSFLVKKSLLRSEQGEGELETVHSCDSPFGVSKYMV